ncbi:hypothetical protein B566_EDAN009126 [Ephemera danica]|nr:hypothetical protein B566_EDAN009126 [Ephemera danica]
MVDYGLLTERSQRWAPFGEPYQQRLVSLLPSNPPLQTAWPPIPPYPSPWPVESSPSWPDPVLPPWSPYSWPQPPAPSVIYPPPQAPVTLLAGPQEQSSRDLDVGVYTGIDTPFTQMPPFSRTVYPGYSGSPQPAAIFPSEWKPRDLDMYSATNEIRPLLPYPWLRQQGGFNVKPSDSDVKLTVARGKMVNVKNKM